MTVWSPARHSWSSESSIDQKELTAKLAKEAGLPSWFIKVVCPGECVRGPLEVNWKFFKQTAA